MQYLAKNGWTPGRPLPGGNNSNRGLVNPLQQQGFTKDIMSRTTAEELYQHGLEHYPEDDPHYPEKFCRPGLGSRPKNADGEDPGFDCTTQTDQSKIHFPGADKIRLHNGAAVTKDQLKNQKCPMKPPCDSQRRGFRQRKMSLCDVCKKKMVHTQSGNARSRRTEKRLNLRAEKAKQIQSNIIEVPESSTQEPRKSYSLQSERIIKCQPRTSWRRPCLQNVSLLVIGDSQVARLETLLKEDAVQASYAGMDIADLCCLLEFGSMKLNNFGNDPRRNHIVANWNQYSKDLADRKCHSCGVNCWGWYDRQILISVGCNNYLKASIWSRDIDVPSQEASLNKNGNTLINSQLYITLLSTNPWNNGTACDQL